VPCFKVFKAMQTYLPDRLTDSLVDGCFRLYTTRDSGYRQLILWAVNLSDTNDKTLRVQLQNLPTPVSVASITRKKLAAYGGETSLTMINDPTEIVGWTDTDLTGQIDPADFTMTFDSATLTMLIFDMDVIDAPIVLSTTSLAHDVFIGNGIPDDVVTVASGGSDTLNYTIETDVPWLSVEPSAGACSRQADPITVHCNIADLRPGQYNGSIRIVSDDALNSPQTIAVAITIETARADFDRDGDVDLRDLGHMQDCLSGISKPQTDPSCADARLDNDADVDRNDMALFLSCLSGPDSPPDPECAP
jgi:hypothetical protein